MPIERHAARSIGSAIADLRVALGWSQRELARRVGMSQSWISRVERGAIRRVTVEAIESLLRAMGARLILSADAPYLADRRHQTDAAHVQLSAYVCTRLRRAGWRVATEVEVGGERSRGWIDVVAWHALTGAVLVVELKTEIHDLGAIQRTLGWYERGAWTAARRLGWRPSAIHGWILLLATEANDVRASANRSLLAAEFPGRAGDLRGLVEDGASSTTTARRRGVALVDPRSRRTSWIRPLRVDGRRSPAPYADYAAFMRATRSNRRRRDAA